MDLRPKKILFLDLSAHFLITLIFSVFIYLRYLDFKMVGLVFLGGILIDLDHLFDYFLFFGWDFRLDKFLSSYFLLSGKVYLPFHSWELIFILSFFTLVYNSLWLSIFTLSLGLHILTDHIQRKDPLFYFMLYRLFCNFEVGQLCPELAQRSQNFS